MAAKILIVDDSFDYVEAMTTLLESKGYTVESAPNGKEGYQKAKSSKPDLILLDVMMSTKTEGFDTARSFQSDEETNKIPVIMVTGVRKEMSLPFKFEPDSDWLPVKAVLEKPIKPETLLRTVEDALK